MQTLPQRAGQLMWGTPLLNERHMSCARRKDRTLCEHKTPHNLLSITIMHSTSLMPVRQLLFIYCKAGPDQAIKRAHLHHIWYISCVTVQLMFHCPHDDHATVALEMMAVTGPFEVMNGTPL